MRFWQKGIPSCNSKFNAMNVVLIGMPGSGKSTFGKYVAQILNMPFIDTDSEICKNHGEIKDIFERGGEKLFREIELKECERIGQSQNAVIATGGGVVKSIEAMRALYKNSLIVYLQCDTSLLAKRVLSDEIARPLLNGSESEIIAKLEQMQSERSQLYLKYAQIVLNVSGILESRNLLQSELSDQLGALYIELLLALEQRVHKKFE